MSLAEEIEKMKTEEKRHVVARMLLRAVGYHLSQLEFLGQGTYNTVYKGPHPNSSVNPGMVAIKVVSGPADAVHIEKASARELQKLKPKDWSKYEDKFDAFARALCVPSVEVDPRYVKQAKYYRKYFNIPEIYGMFNERQVRKIILNEIKKETRKDQEIILKELWSRVDPELPNSACIFIAPLAEGDMWKLFKREVKNLEEFTEHMRDIRKAAKDTLKALVVLHAKGRLHLDIKPDNILKTTNEKGKTVMQLADFGLLDVKTTPNNDQMQESGGFDRYGHARKVVRTPSPIGTPTSSNSAKVRWKVTSWYKAPEQARDAMLDVKQMTKIDIYALGATLLIMYHAAKTSTKDAWKVADLGGGIQPMIRRLPNYMKMVDRDAITVMSPEIRKAEKELLDLIRYMTLDDPKQRPTAAEALTHAFIKRKI